MPSILQEGHVGIHQVTGTVKYRLKRYHEDPQFPLLTDTGPDFALLQVYCCWLSDLGGRLAASKALYNNNNNHNKLLFILDKL